MHMNFINEEYMKEFIKSSIHSQYFYFDVLAVLLNVA